MDIQEIIDLLEKARNKKPEDFIKDGTLYDGRQRYCGYLHSVIFQVLTLLLKQPKCKTCGLTSEERDFYKDFRPKDACPDCKQPKASEFTKRVRTQPYDPKWKHTLIIQTEDRDELCDRLDRAEAINKDLLEVLKDALKNMDGDAVQCVGDWQKGMFCGLEDINITDRYEACMFGYEKALEKIQEWVICGFEAAIAKAKKEGRQ